MIILLPFCLTILFMLYSIMAHLLSLSGRHWSLYTGYLWTIMRGLTWVRKASHGLTGSRKGARDLVRE